MSELLGFAKRAKMTEARRAFADGATVVVTERDEGPEHAVWSDTTTHHRDGISWDELHSQVKMWRSRYPRQTFYVMGD